MKRHNRDYRGAGKEVWDELEHIIAKGYSADNVFRDFLDLILDAKLSLTDNIQRHGGAAAIEKLKNNALDGAYNDRYLTTVRKYKNDGEMGKRPVDYFAKAAAMLIAETFYSEVDVLGEIFMQAITFGEHGQFFTPEHITDMMAKISGGEKKERETVMDPACGSGRTLIAYHKQNPNAILHGIDLDERCAKMCALNMLMFDCDAVVLWGNSLSNEFYKQWTIRPQGWVIETDVKAIPKETQAELPLAA
jgi:type I restriction-modification system DNA methylase subunit